MLKLLGYILLNLISLSRTFMYKKGFLKTNKFGCRVISIGNLSMGGSGKTPMVLLIAEYFKNKKKIAIVEKGYKNKMKKGDIFLIEKNENSAINSFRYIGDEPLMILDSMPHKTRLAVCSDKTKAVASLIKEWPDTELIIIDDGFQHLKLHRDLNIVLIDASVGFSDNLFPKGHLREPYLALKRADIVVFTRSACIDSEQRENLINLTKKYKKGINIYFSIHKFKTNNNLAGKKVLPVSAIANPKNFHKDLIESGAVFKKYISFRDHHKYNFSDYEYIRNLVVTEKPEYVVMTKKDLVKLEPNINFGVPVVSAWYEHKIDMHEEEFLCSLFPEN